MRSTTRIRENSSSISIPHWLWIAVIITVVLGIVGLVLGFIYAQLATWLWLLIAFLIISGIANGMIAWAAAFRVAQTRWTPAVVRIGQSAIASVPLLILLLIVVLVGVPKYQPWVTTPIPKVQAWLNVPFLVIRDAVVLGIFWFLSLLLVRWSLLADARHLRGEEISEQEHRRLNAIAVGVIAMYAFTSSIIAIDFIMALFPKWTSTVFPPYYFCTNFYIGLMVIIILATVLRGPLGVEQYLKPQQFKDMGNLILAFALFNMGLFFAQYLTIWYENLPYETDFLLIRYMYGSWPWVAWPAFIVAYGVPFVILQSRYIKQHSRLISIVAVFAILGFMVERYTLVVPSLKPESLMLFLPPILVLLTVISLFILSILLFMKKYSPVSYADEDLQNHRRERVMV